MGIPAYNAECRSIVMRYSTEWKQTIERVGRWIDFENDYKTLNLGYMESVWWVFSEMFDKGLVYRGLRVMPYSTGCTTPLSNFEAGSDYRDVSDPAGAIIFLVYHLLLLKLSLFNLSVSHCFVPARGRSYDLTPRMDHNPLDTSEQSRTLCPSRFRLHQDSRRN